MGTRGYRVVRWRGYYLVIYNHSDSYPEDRLVEGLGLDILQTIPTDPARYQEWLEAQRKNMDQRIGDAKSSQIEEDYYNDDGNEKFGRIEPQNDIFIEWMYELDLDHEVFLVDGEPLFALNRVPPADNFEEYIGFDAYEHRSYHHDTPEEYRYNWKVPPRPVDHSIITKYETLVTGTPTTDIYTLLGTQGPGARDTPDLAHLGVTMLALGPLPMIIEGGYPSLSKRAIKPIPTIGLDELLGEYVWIIKDVCCVRMCTHLDDEANAKAAIVALIERIQATAGILEQEAAMTIAGKTSYTHSPVLQLLPSWHSRDLSTPGISAIAHLGCLLTPIALSNRFSIVEDPSPLRSANLSVVTTVPGEIWHIIASQLHFSEDLSTLASISSTARAAAIHALSYPHVDGATLLSLGPAKSVSEFNTFNTVYEPFSYPKPQGHHRYRSSLPNSVRSYTHEAEGILTFEPAIAGAGIRVYDANSIWVELRDQKPRGFRKHMATDLKDVRMKVTSTMAAEDSAMV
ncbi:hypothetical protein D9758_013121 [Tetrapyrgos nigripes]|uniref:Uncharacterized protein n=1 Tax=Tetrapyrgos nigripes TaxID=182062 RepID=A0A8H5CA53_9AGAR|nr:hypothetical protein D9758_013121 [Tetrapyrgos nigripes]